MLKVSAKFAVQKITVDLMNQKIYFLTYIMHKIITREFQEVYLFYKI